MKHMPTILVILACRGRGRGLRVGGQPGLQCETLSQKVFKEKKIKGERREEDREKEGEGRGETTERFVD